MLQQQYIKDDNGKNLAVIIPIKKYTRMIEKLEDKDDVKLFDKAKNRKLEFIDAEDVFLEIEQKRKNA